MIGFDLFFCRCDTPQTPFFLIGTPTCLFTGPDDEDGRTPLHLAASQGHADVVRALVGWPGVDMAACDDDDKTPLHLAAAAGHHLVVQILVDSGQADVNATDDQGQVGYNEGARMCVF